MLISSLKIQLSKNPTNNVLAFNFYDRLINSYTKTNKTQSTLLNKNVAGHTFVNGDDTYIGRPS